MLNRCLAEAIFANKVLLVEGPSEYALFNKILSVIHPFYESDGIYVLPVNGIGFDAYHCILNKLAISCIIKTDNDLRSAAGEYTVLGFSRCNKIIQRQALPTERIQTNTVDAKRDLYNANQAVLDSIRSTNNVFLSKVDLENDLDEFMHERLVEILGVDHPVEYLQSAKLYNMVQLVENLSDVDCNNIYNHYNFECLKAVD